MSSEQLLPQQSARISKSAGPTGRGAARHGRLRKALQGLMLASGVVATAAAVVVKITEPERSVRPSMPVKAKAAASVHLYSDDWTDDSGYGLAVQHSLPIGDPASLEAIRAAYEGRARRGLARLTEQLARCTTAISQLPAATLP
jgi:hypothetical protein